MLSLYHKLGRNMSLMINILHSHLDFFPDNCGMFSNEHGELSVRKLQRWRNDIRESGPLPCWLARNAPEQLFKRQAKRIRKYKWTFIATCLMYTYLKCILNVCWFLRNRSQFWVFIVIFVLSASKLIRNGYYYLRSIRSLKICCPV